MTHSGARGSNVVGLCLLKEDLWLTGPTLLERGVGLTLHTRTTGGVGPVVGLARSGQRPVTSTRDSPLGGWDGVSGRRETRKPLRPWSRGPVPGSFSTSTVIVFVFECLRPRRGLVVGS